MKKKSVKSAAKSARKAKTAKRSVSRTTKKTVSKATARRVPKRQTTKKPATSKRAVPATQVKGLASASEVSVTDNAIIVTREVSENKHGRYQRSEVRDYFDKTPANMAALNRKLESADKNAAVKKITVKFKR